MYTVILGEAAIMKLKQWNKRHRTHKFNHSDIIIAMANAYTYQGLCGWQTLFAAWLVTFLFLHKPPRHLEKHSLVFTLEKSAHMFRCLAPGQDADPGLEPRAVRASNQTLPSK